MGCWLILMCGVFFLMIPGFIWGCQNYQNQDPKWIVSYYILNFWGHPNGWTHSHVILLVYVSIYPIDSKDDVPMVSPYLYPHNYLAGKSMMSSRFPQLSQRMLAKYMDESWTFSGKTLFHLLILSSQHFKKKSEMDRHGGFFHHIFRCTWIRIRVAGCGSG